MGKSVGESENNELMVRNRLNLDNGTNWNVKYSKLLLCNVKNSILKVDFMFSKMFHFPLRFSSRILITFTYSAVALKVQPSL